MYSIQTEEWSFRGEDYVEGTNSPPSAFDGDYDLLGGRIHLQVDQHILLLYGQKGLQATLGANFHL